jgi:hypothetical protein
VVATLLGTASTSATDVPGGVQYPLGSCLRSQPTPSEWSPPDAFLRDYLVRGGMSPADVESFLRGRILKPAVAQPSNPSCYGLLLR